MNRLHSAVLVGLGLLSLTANAWGQAVSVDSVSLLKRLDSIEQRLKMAETRQMARGASIAPTGAGGTYTANDLERRMGDLEQDVSQQRGSVDRVSFALEKLAKRFDDFSKDVDLRLEDIEGRLGQLEAKPVAIPATPASAPSAPVVAAAASVGTAGQMAVAAGTSASVAVSAAKASDIPATMTPTDHYNKAYAYLTAADYGSAQVWLAEFLKRHPKDKLAENAYYWLGEVYLVQNNPSAAVIQFRNGLQAFPKGAKAPANLFKMGTALEILKQPKLARGAWEKVVKDYPTTPEAGRAKDKLLALKQAGN